MSNHDITPHVYTGAGHIRSCDLTPALPNHTNINLSLKSYTNWSLISKTLKFTRDEDLLVNDMILHLHKISCILKRSAIKNIHIFFLITVFVKSSVVSVTPTLLRAADYYRSSTCTFVCKEFFYLNKDWYIETLSV